LALTPEPIVIRRTTEARQRLAHLAMHSEKRMMQAIVVSTSNYPSPTAG
jgi:hypothetical protein